MSFKYQNNHLHLVQNEKSHDLLSLVKQNDTPIYIYDLEGLIKRLQYFKKHTAPAHIFYSMKANSNLDILKAFYKEGVGIDIVSGGELSLALQAGFLPKNIVFSGVGKTKEEIKQAIEANILQFNIESIPELIRISKIATAMDKKTRVAFRMNPDINLETHPYIKTGLKEHKFGLEIKQLPELKKIIKQYASHITLHGLTLHMGSQIKDISPLKLGILKIKTLYQELQKEFNLKTFDIGGGLGIDYQNQNNKEDLKLIKQYGDFINDLSKNMEAQIITEPGRIITARFGCLIGEIQYLKHTSFKNFVILNTGMHHLMRPCLYQAYHNILPLIKTNNTSPILYDVVGPICESSDIIGKNRTFSGLKEGDLMAILDTGAYGFVMAHYYNLHQLPKELIIYS